MAPFLDEKLLRLSAGALALAFDHGGVCAVASASGLALGTVSAGVRDLEAGSAPTDRTRRPGGGRLPVEELEPGLWPALDALIEPDERGDPMNPLRWTTKSTRVLADQLAGQGFPVSHATVGRLLRVHGYSLQATAKLLEGSAEHGEDRNKQFHYINTLTRQFIEAGQPVISVDTKKKEPIGNFEAKGRVWRPKGRPVKVEDHTFAKDIDQTAVPYGVYDLGADEGFVNVGHSADTPEFAIASIRRWWREIGAAHYPQAARLLITADAGGSNAARSLVFKAMLHRLALETGLEITMCHFPPGTSKFNKIEHRLFAHISHGWRGRPLTSMEIVVNTIGATTTRTGMTVTCVLDENDYPTGNTGSWDEIDTLPITFHEFRGTWNYTLAPTPARTLTDEEKRAARSTRCAPGRPGRPAKSAATPLGTAEQQREAATALSTPPITDFTQAQWTRLAVRIDEAYRQERAVQAASARGHRPSAYPNRHPAALKTDIRDLMLAAVLNAVHRVPIQQINQIIDLNHVSLSKHVKQLIPIFEQLGHPLRPRDQDGTKKLDEVLALVGYHTPTTANGKSACN